MNNIDQQILNALKDAGKQEQLSEQDATALHLIGRSFNGMFRYTFVFVVLFQLVAAGLTAWCVYSMINAEMVSEQINWLAGGIGAFVVFAVLRLWLFMELNRLSVLREIKRVELQLSLLSEAVLKGNLD